MVAAADEGDAAADDGWTAGGGYDMTGGAENPSAGDGDCAISTPLEKPNHLMGIALMTDDENSLECRQGEEGEQTKLIEHNQVNAQQ